MSGVQLTLEGVVEACGFAGVCQVETGLCSDASRRARNAEQSAEQAYGYAEMLRNDKEDWREEAFNWREWAKANLDDATYRKLIDRFAVSDFHEHHRGSRCPMCGKEATE